MSNPFHELGLPDDATRSEVEAAWRHLRSLYHPDKGGDNDKFISLMQAYTKAVAIAPEERTITCPDCQGTGRRRVVGGFYESYVQCRLCRGAGRL